MKTKKEVLEEQLKNAKWKVQYHTESLEAAKIEVEAFQDALDQPELGNGGEPIANPNPEQDDFAERKCGHERS